MPSTPQEALAIFDRAVWIITARAGDDMSGLVATFVNSASLVPSLPRLTAGIACHHFTWELIRRSQAFAAHLIDEETIDLAWRFGLDSGRRVRKYDGVGWHPGPSGSPILDRALAWVDCRLEADFDTGDRSIFLGAVIDGGVTRPGTPLSANRLFALATPEQVQRMDGARVRDERIDEAALLSWRAARSRQP